MLSPSPVPIPIGFVVKKGLNIFSKFSLLIPIPLSLILHITKSSSENVLIVINPFFSRFLYLIACTALINKFNIT